MLTDSPAPHGLPYITADWDWNPDGDLAPYNPWKMNDGLLWYDTTPDNRWTNNQSTVPYAHINITLPRARRIHSISLAIFADSERGGVVDCPDGIKIDDLNTGRTLAFKKPWTDCVPNALNTVPFANPANSDANETTPSANFVVETDFLQITLSDKLHYTTAISEIQIWVAPNTGPRYEAEDGLLGTYIGGVVQGRETGTNSTIEDGGVTLGGGAWIEWADVRRADDSAGQTSLTVVGGGQGSVEVQMNWLTNHTLTFDGHARKTVDVDMLRGGNVVTILQTDGKPSIDAIIVEE